MLAPPSEFKQMPCNVFMNKIPPSAKASDKLVDVARRLLENNYDSVLVYDGDTAIGLVTIKDIVRYLIEIDNKNTLTVGEMVTVPLITVKIDTSLQDAFSRMDKFKTNYVAVEKDKIIKGILLGESIQEFCEKNSHYLRAYY